MHIRELAKKTVVYADVNIEADPIEWSDARVVVAYRSDSGEWSLEAKPGFELIGYIHPEDDWGSGMNSSKLPVEFFNHQLQDYDPHSEESVRSFVTEWGFPFLPLRNMAKNVTAWRYQDRDRIDAAVSATEALRDFAHVLGSKYLDDEYKYENGDPDIIYEDEEDEDGDIYYLDDRTEPVYGDVIPTGSDADYYRGLYDSTNIGICDAISLEEASLTLEMLQQAIEALMDTIKSGSSLHMRYLDTINMGSSNSRMLLSATKSLKSYSAAETEQQQYSLLTAAICNQVIDAFDDPIPWRECACEGCGVIFKRKQSKANAPTSDSIYCCTACEERQKKRNQRAAAKNRIQH